MKYLAIPTTLSLYLEVNKITATYMLRESESEIFELENFRTLLTC